MGSVDNSNNKSKSSHLIRNLAFISVNLGEYSTSWQASSFLNVNLFCCWFLVILTVNIVIKISLTNIPINKCVHIPNAYFFLNFIIYLSHFKSQHALVGFRGRPPQNTKGPLSTLPRTLSSRLVEVTLVSHSESFIILFPVGLKILNLLSI